MMRTHAAYSPILDDLVDLFEPNKPGPIRLAG
jgi:hypothetical protein